MQIPNEVIEKVSKAIIKLMKSAGEHISANCLLQSQFAQHALNEAGYKTEMVAGSAAWRIGPGDSDMIVHSPQAGGHAATDKPSMAFHAWLQYGDFLLDFTTYTLAMKAAALDEIDGQTTQVDWNPDYLAVPRSTCKSLHETTQALNAGVYSYVAVPGLIEKIAAHGLIRPLDEEDISIFMYMVSNPGLVVVGPNDVKNVLDQENQGV